MSTTDVTVNEISESLNGYDEIAVKSYFQTPVGVLSVHDKTMFVRALIFVDQRRKGSRDGDAYDHAIEMRMVDVQHYFADEPDDVMPDEPTSESGKDDSSPA